MAIDVTAAIVGHDEPEALLIVEEFDPAVDHGAAGTGFPTAATARFVTAKAVAAAAAKPVSTAKPVAETVIPAITVSTAAKSITTAEALAAPVPISTTGPVSAETVAAGSISAGTGAL